ncbi:MAG: GspH/FimT family pseudopilin [Candidatus Accumulibacter propinquus]|uniref:GspH/FimT family pseudopilin n=1 Tax=Candidatus Accumulibacter propinquus TaxID=2954380 RepID=UPI002FC300B1
MKTRRGFSLVELLVGMAILGVLLAIAMPAFSNWLRNARVRTAAESVQNGLQLARSEAVRRNTTIRFQLVDTTDDGCALSTAGPNWVVSFDSPVGACATPPSDTVAPRIIQLRSGAEGSAATTLAADQSALVFNSLGRLTPVPAATVTINVASATGELCLASGGPIRCLQIMVTLGGQIRMCDPALAVGDAQACT